MGGAVKLVRRRRGAALARRLHDEQTLSMFMPQWNGIRPVVGSELNGGG